MDFYIKVDEKGNVVEGYLQTPVDLENFVSVEIEEDILHSLMESGKPLKYISNEIVVDSVQEQINNLEQEIIEAKQYLLETDYVVIKINEYKLQDKPVDSLLTKYSNELEERKDKRILINTLEQEIQNLKL